MDKTKGLEAFIKRSIQEHASKPDSADWLVGQDVDLSCICDWLTETLLKSELDSIKDTFFKECLLSEIFEIMKDPKWIWLVKSLQK